MNHDRESLRVDRPIAALLTDLRRRGMLDDTLVLFTSEFGRTPFTQSKADVLGKGRDHNQYGFSVWMTAKWPVVAEAWLDKKGAASRMTSKLNADSVSDEFVEDLTKAAGFVADMT